MSVQKEKMEQERLWKAIDDGALKAARVLLEKGTVDVNAGSEWLNYQSQWSVRDHAPYEYHLEFMALLLEAGADPNAADENGWAPLHFAAYYDHAPVARLLLKFGADPNASTKGGRHTPLHFACEFDDSDLPRELLSSRDDLCAGGNVVSDLLAFGADVHAKDSEGHGPLHYCIDAKMHDLDYTADSLEKLQVLASCGAAWDAECDEMISSGKACTAAPAFRVSMSLWTQQRANGFPLTMIPFEIIRRGAESTQAYIDDFKKSSEIVLRRKICLVGSRCAGKTSLVKSIISKEPQLEHVDDRTIGIDHFPLRFSESSTTSDGKRKIHEVTFWDFAGQDAYQVAHSLFFSPRTLYLVCVDLGAFAIAYMQAVIFADEETQEINLLDEFVEDSVMRWVRMIVARQPDAEFVFITTKEDALADNKVTEDLLKDSLMTKLRHVQATVQKVRGQLKKEKKFADDGLMFRAQLPVVTGAPKPIVVPVSCTSTDSVKAARIRIEELIVQSERSFEMPYTYTKTLEAIVGIRDAAQANNMTTRIHRIFAPAESLPAVLNIEPKLCHTILQTLHDLGDVLWYEDLGVELFKNTVILEPLLLIDFIRQIFNHKHTGVTMTHADLTSKRFWMGLSNEEQIKAMKQVLYKFHLVYPDDEERIMRWDSDLIVPAFWQTKTPASWKFLGDILRINKTRSHEGEAVRIDWEYHFQFGLPSPLFDHVVVASVYPYFEFDAGPDWIVYEENEVAACRIMVGRDSKSLHQIIHVEAVVAQSATAEQVANLWSSFEQLCGAFVGVLQEYRGLTGVSSFACDDKGKRINLMRLVQSPKNVPTKWMPPVETWKWYKELVTKRA